MTIVKKPQILRNDRGGKQFAKGKKAIAICQRSGFKYLQSEMVFEPGTNYFVHKNESDKSHNLVTDDLNFPSVKSGEPEGKPLRFTSTDVPLSIAPVVTPTSLSQVDGIIQSSFYAYPGTSVTTTE
jgi:hypothetical protein